MKLFHQTNSSRVPGLSFLACALVWGFSQAKAGEATNAPPPKVEPDILFDYNHYVGWIPPTQSQNSFTTKMTTLTASDPYTGLATGTLVEEQAISAYQKSLNDQVSVRYEDQIMASPVLAVPSASGAEPLAHQQKLSLQVAPANQISLTGDVHSGMSQTDSNGVTSGIGLGVTAPLPFHAQLNLQTESDQEMSDSLFGPATQTHLWQAQVLQPIGKLPLTAVLSGGEATTVSSGSKINSPSMEQALELKLRKEDTFRLGVRELQYVEMNNTEYSNSLYADFSHQVNSQMTWHSSADMLHLQGLETASSEANANLSPLDSKAFTVATGPAFVLRNDLTARVEFSNTWDKSNEGPSTEHRISLSVNGSF